MKKIAIKLLSGKMGWAIKAATAALASLIVNLIKNGMGIEVTPEQEVKITGGVFTVVLSGMQWAIGRLHLEGNKNIQKELKKLDPSIELDRWAGEKTLGVLTATVKELQMRKKDKEHV